MNQIEALNPPTPMVDSWWGRKTTIGLRDLRLAGGLMLAAAAIRPLLGDGDLGLPCLLRSVTGVPCPLCGMTTSVTAAVHLRILDALAANPAGLLAVVVAIVLLARRRWLVAVLPVWLVPSGLSAMWLFELARYGWLPGLAGWGSG